MRKKPKKNLISLVLVSVLLLVVWGGGATAAVVPELTQPVELVIWHHWADHHPAEFQKLLDAFNEQHDMITVVQQSHPRPEFDANLMNSLRAGVGPDIVPMFTSLAAFYVAQDLLLNLTPFIDDETIGIPGFRESIPEGKLRDISQFRDEQIYMMPVMTGGLVFFYNKTLFDSLGLSAPATWTELEETSRILYEETGRPGFGMDSLACLFQMLTMQAGEDYIDVETRTVAFDNETSVEKIAWFADLVQEGVFRLVGTDMFFSGPFGSEAVAAYIGNIAGYNFMRIAVDDKFEVGFAPPPQEGPVGFVPNFGPEFVAFRSTPERGRAAYEFMRFLHQPENAAQWAIAFGGIPAPLAALEVPMFQDYMEQNLAVQALASQVDRFGFLPAVPGADAVRNEIVRMMESAALGIMTPEEALREGVAASNSEIAP